MEAETEAVLDEPEAPLGVAVQSEQIGHPVQGLAQVVQRVAPYGFRMKREQRAPVVRTEPQVAIVVFQDFGVHFAGVYVSGQSHGHQLPGTVVIPECVQVVIGQSPNVTECIVLGWTDGLPLFLVVTVCPDGYIPHVSRFYRSGVATVLLPMW